ncbi:hypothetical protein EGR_10528 [Echinococcus granulosus]|uniref:Uncharacterized protein n=1 Tax=Echinococcus granulosus TaxID=6210 RepID=W6U883_ECHGR|nr:hypothetical protein EGR_10528 [Echinococcus granulosus]EUB54607.1 hypothetical protein EGR_10528 [Echinococcus granulosus]
MLSKAEQHLRACVTAKHQLALPSLPQSFPQENIVEEPPSVSMKDG